MLWLRPIAVSDSPKPSMSRSWRSTAGSFDPQRCSCNRCVVHAVGCFASAILLCGTGFRDVTVCRFAPLRSPPILVLCGVLAKPYAWACGFPADCSSGPAIHLQRSLPHLL